MRRALWVVGLVGLGVLLGFLVRLIRPRLNQAPVYDPPVADVLSEERRTA